MSETNTISLRQSNFELLRIIAMLMIVLVHANYYSLGAPNQSDIQSTPFLSFWRIFAEQICIVGVNVFILISGWFGIKPSLKGLCSFLYQVFFWGCLLVLVGLLFNLDLPIKPCLKVFWFGGYYWFIIAYIGLYLISPVLNAFLDKTTPKSLLALIICYFITEFIFGWIINSESYNAGYSAFSFIGLYLLARFVRLYASSKRLSRPIIYLLIYFLMTTIPTIISIFAIKSGGKQLHPLFYTSPFVITAAASLLLFFSTFKFKNAAINWIGCSTFCIYLIHTHPVILPRFTAFVQHLWGIYQPIPFSFIIVLFSIAFLVICASLDKIRIISWKWISSHFMNALICKSEKAFDKLLIRILQ